MDFSRVNEALEACVGHLDATKTRNTEVESYLVNYLLSIIYADYEQTIRKLVATRCGKDGDISTKSFSEWASERLVRSIDVSDLKGVLARFHSDHKDYFAGIVENDPAATAYSNIIVNRHAVAHKRGSNMTLRELEEAFTKSRKIVEAFDKALALAPGKPLQADSGSVG